MIREDVNDIYLDWLYSIVADDRYSTKNTYRKLFDQLYNTEFTYTIPMDGNRFEDGVNLRYRFGRDNGYDEREIATYLDYCPCSVLEMMIALAIKCEDHIMDNPDLGNRVGQWFWEMIVCLGLGSMKDSNYDPDYVDSCMDIFLNRKYKRDGEGGLFRIHDRSKDMRTTDIWYQMCWYLNEVLENKA